MGRRLRFGRDFGGGEDAVRRPDVAVRVDLLATLLRHAAHGADGELLRCEPAAELPLARRYNLF